MEVVDGVVEHEISMALALTGADSIVGRAIAISTSDNCDNTDGLELIAWGVIGVTSDFTGSASTDMKYAKCYFQGTINAPSVSGFALLKEVNNTVEIYAEIKGLNGTHGFHIHEVGNISSDDGTAAGGHYNPNGVEHGLPDSDKDRHLGDLGNIKDQGDAEVYTFHHTFTDFISLSGEHGVLGRAMMIHQKEDIGTQPAGDAGSRYAQCVIGATESFDMPSSASKFVIPAIIIIALMTIVVL